jgi:hypothetical protein
VGHIVPKEGGGPKATKKAIHACPKAAPGAKGPCKKPPLPAAAPCDGAGFSDPDMIAAFVKDFKNTVVKGWDKKTPAQRFLAVWNLQKKQFANLNIPVPTVLRSSNAADGWDNPATLYGAANDKAWSMTFNGNLFTQGTLSEVDQKELAKTMMHEGRHIEQYYKIAQYRAATGDDAKAITTTDTPTHKPANIPGNVAKRAAAQRLPSKNKAEADCPNYDKAKKWNDAKYGKGALSQYTLPYNDRPLEKDAFALESTIDAKW